jgi:hypothetical protein
VADGIWERAVDPPRGAPVNSSRPWTVETSAGLKPWCSSTSARMAESGPRSSPAPERGTRTLLLGVRLDLRAMTDVGV